jgi:FkbM family methyltransferase
VQISEILNHIESRWQHKILHDEDFAAFRLLEAKKNIVSVIDVGANAGQSLSSFRLVLPTARIDSFEANPMMRPALDRVAALVGENAHVHMVGLGDAPSDATLHIPFAGNDAFYEVASLSTDYYQKPWVPQMFESSGGLTKLEPVSVRIEVGDSFELDPQVIKVDVEGLELSVLKGFAKTIMNSQPAIMVENSDWSNVTDFLAQFDYRPYRYIPSENQLVPFHGQTTNTFYLGPNDRAAMEV